MRVYEPLPWLAVIWDASDMRFGIASDSWRVGVDMFVTRAVQFGPLCLCFGKKGVAAGEL